VTKIGLKRLLRVSSKLLVRTQRSYVIHIVTADSVEFSGHGVNTTVDVIDQSLDNVEPMFNIVIVVHVALVTARHVDRSWTPVLEG